jgi:hypothetical protein
MPTFSVRAILRWSPRPEQQKSHLYEERITLWNAESLEQAIDLAEREAKEYAGTDAECLDLFQGFWLFDAPTLPSQGIEVFSLLRESDLEPKAYIDTFFDTGCERQGVYKAEPSASPNGGPAASVDNSNASGGPPSVS